MFLFCIQHNFRVGAGAFILYPALFQGALAYLLYFQHHFGSVLMHLLCIQCYFKMDAGEFILYPATFPRVGDGVSVLCPVPFQVGCWCVLFVFITISGWVLVYLFCILGYAKNGGPIFETRALASGPQNFERP